MARKPNPEFMAGVPELIILALLQNEEMYGYQIVQSIQDGTAGVISLSEGVVYSGLRKLTLGGVLKARSRSVDGRDRVYYSITKAGKRRFEELSDVWRALNKAIHKVLGTVGPKS